MSSKCDQRWLRGHGPFNFDAQKIAAQTLRETFVGEIKTKIKGMCKDAWSRGVPSHSIGHAWPLSTVLIVWAAVHRIARIRSEQNNKLFSWFQYANSILTPLLVE